MVVLLNVTCFVLQVSHLSQWLFQILHARMPAPLHLLVLLKSLNGIQDYKLLKLSLPSLYNYNVAADTDRLGMLNLCRK